MGKIRIKTPEKLSISGALFYELREKFDKVLNQGIQTITDKSIEEMKMTVNISVKLTEDDSEDTPNADTYIPMIDCKVNANYTEKLTDGCITGGADVQLYRESGSGFIVRNNPYGQQEIDLD